MNLKTSQLTIFLFLYMFVARGQTAVTASSGGTGWKKIAIVSGQGGRGFGTVSLYTTGGAIDPMMLSIDWFHGWGSNVSLSLNSNSLSSKYWSAARITDDGTNAYIEVNFIDDVPTLSLITSDYGWRKATPYSGTLPDGGGTVWATTEVARHNIGNSMVVAYNGNVGIGTTTPREKLSVNGSIRAKEIKVETANWPDYVFEEDYKMQSLREVEVFVKENKHLPGIPSQQEVEGNGVSLGEMNRKLLEKVEELTLHLIELKKEVENLKSKK